MFNLPKYRTPYRYVRAGRVYDAIDGGLQKMLWRLLLFLWSIELLFMALYGFGFISLHLIGRLTIGLLITLGLGWLLRFSQRIHRIAVWGIDDSYWERECTEVKGIKPAGIVLKCFFIATIIALGLALNQYFQAVASWIATPFLLGMGTAAIFLLIGSNRRKYRRGIRSSGRGFYGTGRPYDRWNSVGPCDSHDDGAPSSDGGSGGYY